MCQPRATPAIVAICAAAIIVSSCASKPAAETTDPITVSSTSPASRPDRATSATEPQLAQAARPLAALTREDDGSPLTLETAVRLAVTWHPSITEAVSRLGEQNEAVNEARAGYLPRVNWGINTVHDSARVGGIRPNLELSASQMIYDFGKVDGRVEVATAGVSGRRSQVLIAVDDLIRDTAHAVIEVQRSNALRVVARDQVSDVTAIFELVRSRTETGASTRSDLLQAEARVQAAEATLLEIETQLARWTSTLAALTGSQRGVNPGASAPQWLATTCQNEEPDWSRVPAIMQADAEQARAVAQLGLTRAEALPTLSLDASVGTDLARIGSSRPDYRVGLNVTGSLYNGGESGARRNAASHALRSSEAARQTVQLDTRRHLAEASAQAGSMRRLLETLARRQETMAETRDLYQTQYIELGTRTLLDLLNADQELHAARFDEANIRHDLQRLGIDCAFNTGQLRENFSLEGRTLHGVAL